MKLSKLTKPELERISNNANFTEEEQKIFGLISQGKNLQEIACRLSLSKSTVSRRLRDIQDKIERSERDMAVPIWEKVALTVEEAAEYSNIGINRISSLLNEPGCTFALCIGRKRLVKRKEFERYIEKANEI